jgi:thiamine biosynthesis protein ThiS
VNIVLNGEPRSIPAACTAAQLLSELGLAGKRLALEVNHEIVPRSRFDRHEFRDGDKVEIVHAIGGG